MRKQRLRAGAMLALALAFGAYHYFQLGSFFSFEQIKASQAQLAAWYSDEPLLTAASFCAIYILAAALSVPGAAMLTLLAGALFGLSTGVVLVSFSSTIGATFAFLFSRFLFREAVRARFREKLEIIDQGLQREGALYLLSLRLLPLFPFFLVNLAMGVTSIRAGIFFVVSQVGMLPATVLYVNAGTQLAAISSPREILSTRLLISLALIGFFPILAKILLAWRKSGRNLRRHTRPRRFDYNFLVIGGGSAGLVAAYIGAAVKAKVALVEKHRMGGDCLNTGCVPSKALIRSAKIFSYFRRAEDFGLQTAPAKVDFARVMDRVRRVIQAIEPHDSVERFRGLGVDCFQGEAKIRSPFEVEVDGRVLTTRNIVIATGASPFVPRIPGLAEAGYLTSDNLWGLSDLPESLLVLGGGPIGCELAQAFARLGSRVTIVEKGDHLLSREDADVSTHVRDALARDGVEVLTGHEALRVERFEGSHALVCRHGEREAAVRFGAILIALGRRANVAGFGLEELGVELTPQGTIAADECLRTTNFPNIFVCGDVAGPFQFTHTASHQAWYAAVNALFSPFRSLKVDYRVVPWCTFTDPEVARVGLNEGEAKKKGIPYRLTKYQIEDLDRAITDGAAKGFIKVLTPPGSDQVLGATIVGSHAGDVIAELVAAMKHGFGLNKILGTIHIYPTLSEANKLAAGAWKRETSPEWALRLLGRFHSWRRG